jgi:hypothetical protein
VAYDEGLAERIRGVLSESTDFAEKKMFGGLAFMVRGNMCLGVLGETVMARVGKARYAQMLSRQFVREMDFTGKPMTGYVFVDPEGVAEDSDLIELVDLCLEFNESLPPK